MCFRRISRFLPYRYVRFRTDTHTTRYAVAPLGMSVTVKAEALSNNRLAFGNYAYLSRSDHAALGGEEGHALLVSCSSAVFSCRARDDVPPGRIQLSLFQRKAAAVALDEDVVLTRVNPDPALSINTITFTLDVLLKGKLTSNVKLDSGKLAEVVSREFSSQMFKRGQEACVDFEGTPLKFGVVDFTLVTVSETGAAAARAANFGLLAKGSAITFNKVKDAPIDISGGTKYVAIFANGFGNARSLSILVAVLRWHAAAALSFC